MSAHGGCLAKLPGLELENLLTGAWHGAGGADAPFPPLDNPEDCALLNLGGQSLLVSNDLGPLVGRDLRRAGRIAVLHALSDIYAAGGVARWALVVLIVQRDQPLRYAEDVLAGMLQACGEERVAVVGGHTATGAEAMAGITAMGVPRGNRVLRKTGARLGDSLLLSKPLGVGLLTRAYRLGGTDEAGLESALAVMETSNAGASEVALAAEVRAASDVTGFGLLGHLSELLPEGLGAELDLRAIPVLEAARPLLDGKYQTYWTAGNLDYARRRHRLTGVADPARLMALLDPQTNGGLLVAAATESVARLREAGFVPIGRVTETREIAIRLD